MNVVAEQLTSRGFVWCKVLGVFNEVLKRGIIIVVTNTRGKRNRFLRNLLNVLDLLQRHVHFRSKLLEQWLATKVLNQPAFNLLEAVNRLNHVHRNTNGS